MIEMKIRNYTGKSLTILGTDHEVVTTLPPESVVLDEADYVTQAFDLYGIPVYENIRTDNGELPAPESDVLLVIPESLRRLYRYRKDFCSVGMEVKDANGTIGYVGLVKN